MTAYAITAILSFLAGGFVGWKFGPKAAADVAAAEQKVTSTVSAIKKDV